MRRKMPAAELQVTDQSERERVVRWRVQELERAGYDPDAA